MLTYIQNVGERERVMDGERDIILVEMGSRECLFVCEREREREREGICKNGSSQDWTWVCR